MRIIFVRHGHPDYKTDTLTEKGILHAKAAAERLKNEKVDVFYASSCGRAYETCQYIADLHGKREEIIKLDFMRELSWGSYTDEPIFAGGHPWNCAKEAVRTNNKIMRPDWENTPFFSDNKVKDSAAAVAKGIDEWLRELGFTRDGDYYRVGKPKYDTVMLVSHAGSSSAAIGHVLNLPFPYVCKTLSPDFTAITILNFHSGEEGELIAPSMPLFGDARHIEGIVCEQIISN